MTLKSCVSAKTSLLTRFTGSNLIYSSVAQWFLSWEGKEKGTNTCAIKRNGKKKHFLCLLTENESFGAT